MKIARALAVCSLLVLAISSACCSSVVVPEATSGGTCTSDIACQNAGAGIHCYLDDPCFGWSVGCNAPPSCQVDADCGSGNSCRVCGHGTQLCMPACATDTDCGAGASCDANHRCIPQPCQTDAQCPAYFTCSQADMGCIRKTCQQSSDCSPGVCGKGLCYATAGECTSCA